MTARLSVIVATDEYRTIRYLIARLREQTIRDQLEVVVVSLTGRPVDVDTSDVESFAACRLVELGRPVTLWQARAAGVRIATAPIVQIAETHAFPLRPDWAARVVAAATSGCAAFVPGMCNANPEGPISWSNFVTDYGAWSAAFPAGEIDRLPPYNTAYERDFIQAVASRREDVFAAGYDVGVDLREGGHRISFDPNAKVGHVQVSLLRPWLGERFWAARSRASIRSRNWSWRRRLVYALGSPLIPVVLLARYVRPYRAIRRTERLPVLVVPAIVVAVVVSAVGELVAFVAGGGPRCEIAADEYELHKLRYTRLDGAA